MGRKLWALALVAGAAYLFKTKHGAEIRKQVGDAAGKVVNDLKDRYQQASAKAGDAIDAQKA